MRNPRVPSSVYGGGPGGSSRVDDVRWHEVDVADLGTNEVKAVITGGRSVCLARTSDGLSALDNRCPHQAEGPLGEIRTSPRWT